MTGALEYKLIDIPLLSDRPNDINTDFRHSRKAWDVSGYFMETPFWIEKAWGEHVDNATMNDVRVAIKETTKKDDEHGAFWVGHNKNENVLEVHKDLEIFYVFNDNLDNQLKTKLTSWQEAEYLFGQFLHDNYAQIKSFFEEKINEDQN
jgi:hypothetical protein